MKTKEEQFIDAVDSNDLAEVKRLIAEGVDVNMPVIKGMTALIFAAILGYIELASLLIENEADVDARDKRRYTALIHAAEQEHIEIAKILVDNGADVNASNHRGQTVWIIASPNFCLLLQEHMRKKQ